jgi:hypothetical protein
VLRRLVIALTALFAATGVLVVAGYLFIFAAGTDRAAAAVPADADAYVTLYLQPTTGQQLNLGSMLGKVPGFEDAASLDEKLNEISGRLLGQAGVNYEADVRPWLGNQVALALRAPSSVPQPSALTAGSALLLVSVKDRALAEAAVQRIAAERGLSPSRETYQGTVISVAPGASWAVLDDLLLIATDRPMLEAALDAAADRRPSLADDADFSGAMRRLPPDHLAAAYLDISGAAHATGVEGAAAGYSALGVALVAEPDGLWLSGSAPFRADAADDASRHAFAAASQVSTTAAWMPSGTQLAAVMFDLHGLLIKLEKGLADEPAAADLLTSLNQLRALAGFGLGVNIDQDVLPMLDGETGLAISDLATGTPHGELIIRPPDPSAASQTLDKLRNGLAGAGATVTERQAGAVNVVSVDVPQLGSASWGMSGGVLVVGLTYDDVAAAFQAASGTSLADGAAYRDAWRLAGDRGGNELFVDIGSMADASPNAFGMTGDARDILLSISALGLSLPARDDASQLRAALRVR